MDKDSNFDEESLLLWQLNGYANPLVSRIGFLQQAAKNSKQKFLKIE